MMNKILFLLSFIWTLTISSGKEDRRLFFVKKMLQEGERHEELNSERRFGTNKEALQEREDDVDTGLPEYYRDLPNISVHRSFETASLNGIDRASTGIRNKALESTTQHRSPAYSDLTPSQHDAWQ